MSNKEHLIEQHILEYESRQRHIDELYEKAQEAAADHEPGSEAHLTLTQLNAQRSLLRESTEKMKADRLSNLREDTITSAGPMAVWDVLAQKLEDFLDGKK